MTRDLSIGCKGTDVAELQQKLKSLGYYNGTIDGDFGPVTDAAVRAYQASVGIYIDGVVGPITRGTLEGRAESQTVVEENVGDIIKSARQAIQAGNGSIEAARWSGHKWIISSDEIRSFQDLQITGSSDVEKSDDNDQGYFSYKGSNPTEITMTAILNAHAGNDVRSEVENFVMDSKKGINDYIYIGYKKLFATTMILTNASAKKIEVAPNMTWLSAQVSLTFKQGSSDGLGGIKDTSSSDSAGGSSSGGSSSGGGSSGGNGYSGGGGGGSYGSGSKKATVKQRGARTLDPDLMKTNPTIPNNWVGGTAGKSASDLIFTAQLKNGNNQVRGLQSSLNARSSSKTTTAKASSSGKRRMSGQQQ